MIAVLALIGTSFFLNTTASGAETQTEIKWPGLFDIQPVGSLGKFPLVSAKPCKDCAHERALFLLPPTSPERSPASSRYTLFVYPGKVTDPKKQQIVLDSRAFFGRCLASTDDVYIVFQKERVDKRKGPQSSVYIATPTLSSGMIRIEEKLLERKLPNLNHTLKRVKAKQCFEIPGRNRIALKKPLDVPPPPGSSDDANDEDEDDKLKENQDELKAET